MTTLERNFLRNVQKYERYCKKLYHGMESNGSISETEPKQNNGLSPNDFFVYL